MWESGAEVFQILGVIAICYISLRFVTSVCYDGWVLVWGLCKRRPDLVRRYGPWAVVTGCTDGIGKQFAFQLAERKMNVVLISRNPEKLRLTAQHIESSFGVKTLTITADFRRQDIYDDIQRKLGDLDIGILVNNVGFNEICSKEFADVSEDSIWSYINVNVSSATMMSKLALPGMKERKRGAVIFLSSLAAETMLPDVHVYSAAKAFVSAMARRIQYQYRPYGIDIQALHPGQVLTNMTNHLKLARKSYQFGLIPNAETYVRQALASLGLAFYTTGHCQHFLLRTLTIKIPDFIMARVSAALLKNEKDTSSA